MAEKATQELERIYTIPLRQTKTSPRNHQTDRAVRAVKTYLSKHMKAEEVWIDTSVNEKLWERGMYRIPSRIRVRAVKFDDGVVEVSLPEAEVKASIRAELKERREKAEKAKAEEKEEKKEEAKEEAKEEKKPEAEAKAEGEAEKKESPPPAEPPKPEPPQSAAAKAASKSEPKPKPAANAAPKTPTTPEKDQA